MHRFGDASDLAGDTQQNSAAAQITASIGDISNLVVARRRFVKKILLFLALIELHTPTNTRTAPAKNESALEQLLGYELLSIRRKPHLRQTQHANALTASQHEHEPRSPF
jgi:hypothetical protein